MCNSKLKVLLVFILLLIVHDCCSNGQLSFAQVVVRQWCHLLLQGLFRKVMNAEIKPYDLVRLTSEQLASKELAMWREQETKHVR